MPWLKLYENGHQFGTPAEHLSASPEGLLTFNTLSVLLPQE